MYDRQVLYPLRYNAGLNLSKVYHKRTCAHNTCVVCVFSAQNLNQRHLTSPEADSTNDKCPKEGSLSTELKQRSQELKTEEKTLASLFVATAFSCLF